MARRPEMFPVAESGAEMPTPRAGSAKQRSGVDEEAVAELMAVADLFRNYLKKADATFPLTRRQGLGSWGHIPSTGSG